MIWSRNVSINCQVGDLNNQSITNRWNTHKIRFIEMFGKKSKFTICLNAFYNDIGAIKKATILWSVAFWGQYATCRANDNTFIFNRMLGYNTILYDDVDNKRQ